MIPPQMLPKLYQVPLEKTIETLYVSNAFHYLKTKYPELHFSLFAPSQDDEAYLGYDARFVGADLAFEVILQFKRPKLDSGVFSFQPRHRTSKGYSRSQHEILKAYTRGTAYYVAPTFESHADLATKEQRHSKWLLDNYIAVDVSSVPYNAGSIEYESRLFGLPSTALSLISSTGETCPHHYKQDWVCGSELFDLFVGGLGVVLSNQGNLYPQWREAQYNYAGRLVVFGNGTQQDAVYFSLETIAEIGIDRILRARGREYGQGVFEPFRDANLLSDGEAEDTGELAIYIYRILLR